MSTEPATQRARTTCDDCGLPYYADENDACPYCDASASTSADEQTGTTGTEPRRGRESESTSPEQRRSSSRSSSQSLLQRLTYALRDAFRR